MASNNPNWRLVEDDTEELENGGGDKTGNMDRFIGEGLIDDDDPGDDDDDDDEDDISARGPDNEDEDEGNSDDDSDILYLTEAPPRDKPTRDTLMARVRRAWKAAFTDDGWLRNYDQYVPPEHVPVSPDHRVVSGLVIHIENRAGSFRKPEYPVLKAHYGEILGTEGRDADPVDVFLKEGTYDDYNGPVFIIDQPRPDGAFDEHKVMLGWLTQEEAVSAYLASYQVGWKLGPVTRLSLDEFKAWLGAHNRVPVSEDS